MKSGKKKTNIDFTKNIELKNIYHNFENENSYILENINLKIKKNEIIGICEKVDQEKQLLQI